MNSFFASKLGPVLLIVAGLVLIFVSIAWPRLAQPGDEWTPEKAEALEQAYSKLNKLHKEKADGEALQQATEHYQLLYGELQEAKGGVAVLSLVMQMLGVGLGLIGAVAIIARQG